ncbi:hypothetical protein CBM2634_A170167 [Cupriavidus taiwanensis]|uniref:Uncharacterized protein n=1 Tax=Cupriavidus taiwanensis TaxID=164546 RepID=A0A375IWX7_9BURK|nr:hypothetical protein CBM2634_A170167 [Cupriavidus taiwanensis]
MIRRLAEVKRHFETVCNSGGVQLRQIEVLVERVGEWCGNEKSQREAGFLKLVGGTGIEPVTPAV